MIPNPHGQRCHEIDRGAALPSNHAGGFISRAASHGCNMVTAIDAALAAQPGGEQP